MAKHVKICPKCKSTNVRIRWQSFWFYGFPPSFKCLKCGFIGRIFPEINTKNLKCKKQKKSKRGAK